MNEINNRIGTYISLLIFFWLSNGTVHAFPSSDAHFNGMNGWGGYKDLIGTPVKDGGLGDISAEKAIRAGRWMDNPATKTGQYINHKAGGVVVSPSNHGALRHNPLKVENALKWNGSKNLARLHKIQDVVYNSYQSNVDGYLITAKMKKEADVILRYVRRYKKLPKRLPYWVDESAVVVKQSSKIGKFFAGSNLFRSPIFRSTLKTSRNIIRIAGKVAVPIAVTSEIGLVLYDAHQIEERYANHEISYYERNLLHGENWGRSIGSGIAYGAGLVVTLVFSEMGPVAWVTTLAGTVVAAYVLEYAGGKIGHYAAKMYNNYKRAETNRLASINKDYYKSTGIIEMTPSDMQKCGFTEDEIKGNLMAWKSIKEIIKKPMYKIKIGVEDIGKIREYRMDAEFYSEILK